MRPIALALVAFAGGAAGSLVSSGVGQARADASAITVPVPSQGVVFRTPEGRIVARLRSEASGGVFELFDARGQAAVRLRATASGGAVELARVTGVRFAAPPAGATDDSGY